MKKKRFITIGLVIALLPILVSFISASLGKMLGCSVDEGGAHPCLIDGYDYGKTLHYLGMFFIYIYFSVPIGLVFIFIGSHKSNE